MTNAEMTMNDIGNVVCQYERGEIQAPEACRAILALVDDGCAHCVNPYHTCRDNATYTCDQGYNDWLQAQAD